LGGEVSKDEPPTIKVCSKSAGINWTELGFFVTKKGEGGKGGGDFWGQTRLMKGKTKKSGVKGGEGKGVEKSIKGKGKGGGECGEVGGRGPKKKNNRAKREVRNEQGYNKRRLV